MTLYTIGHSTRTAEEFLQLLRRSAIRLVVDVRAFPGSRRHPHFGRDALREWLAEADIAYEHAPALGGRRKRRPESAPTAWRNAGFAAYADYMATDEFRDAVNRLLDRATERRTAVMCSEAVPWRCHRSMISDAVVARGWTVLHLLATSTSSHALSELAVVQGDDVRYPPKPAEPAEQALLPFTPG